MYKICVRVDDKGECSKECNKCSYTQVEDILFAHKFGDFRIKNHEKMELLKVHASQVNKTRVENLTILESAESCATFRGFQGRVKYAEGFKALRVLRDIA